MMKYFTLDGWMADQHPDADPAAASRAMDAYKSYLDSVKSELPSDYRRLLESVCLHDGRLREVRIDFVHESLTLRFDAGDVTMREARHVALHYAKVTEMLSTADPAMGLPGPHGYGDLGNDEIEVLADGRFEHRFVFSSGIELLVRFGAFRFEQLD